MVGCHLPGRGGFTEYFPMELSKTTLARGNEAGVGDPSVHTHTSGAGRLDTRRPGPIALHMSYSTKIDLPITTHHYPPEDKN